MRIFSANATKQECFIERLILKLGETHSDLDFKKCDKTGMLHREITIKNQKNYVVVVFNFATKQECSIVRTFSENATKQEGSIER